MEKMESTVSENKWYVLRVMGGKEKKTRLFIEKEIDRLNLNDFVSRILIPTEKVYQIKDGKKVSKEKNFFPGYLLVEANLSGEVPHVIKALPNVIGFLGETKGGDPIPLRTAEVNRMLGTVDDLSTESESISIPFIYGESIKVIDGPFNGFNGTIEKVNEEKRKLEVMVKIFGRKTPLELSYMQVEKV